MYISTLILRSYVHVYVSIGEKCNYTQLIKFGQITHQVVEERQVGGGRACDLRVLLLKRFESFDGLEQTKCTTRRHRRIAYGCKLQTC